MLGVTRSGSPLPASTFARRPSDRFDGEVFVSRPNGFSSPKRVGSHGLAPAFGITPIFCAKAMKRGPFL